MNEKIIEKLEKHKKELKMINDNITYRLDEYKKMLTDKMENPKSQESS